MLVFWRALRKGSRPVAILACVCGVGPPLGGVGRAVFRDRFLDGRRGYNFLVLRAFPPSDRVAYIASDRLYFDVLMSVYTCWW